MSTWEIVPRADLNEVCDPVEVSAMSLAFEDGFFLFFEDGIKYAIDSESIVSIARIA